jgi:hypothetical protein
MKEKKLSNERRGRPGIDESKQLKPRFTLNLSDDDYNNFIQVQRDRGIKKSALARIFVSHMTTEFMNGKIPIDIVK